MIALLAHILGIDNVSGRWYGFWSGIGGDMSILAAPIVLLRRHNCHAARCWRLGRHPVEGTPWTVCRHHHPQEHPTAQTIRQAADQ